MRTTPFAKNEYYHLCNRSVGGAPLFLDDHDYARFLFLILYLQSPTLIHNISWYANSFVRKNMFPPTETKLKEIFKTRHIELTAFALMPNHFHLLVRNIDDSVLSVYMHRVLTSYSKYFAAKYGRVGHVFQGPFKSVHIKNNVQLLHTSAYIHKNPIDIKECLGIDTYRWSSFQDYIGGNRWGKLLETSIVSEQFSNKDAYKSFVFESTAKEKVPWLSTKHALF